VQNLSENDAARCPNCLADLKRRGSEREPPYEVCTFCGVSLVPIWWQRLLVVGVALVLSFVAAACLSLVGLTLLFVTILCMFPALLLAHVLVFMTIQPRYVTKSEAVTTIFRH
jgi:hypothetical protein